MMPAKISPFLTCPAEAFGKPVCRFGLALYVSTTITADDVLGAIERGINFLNWPGEADYPGGRDAFSDAVGSLGPRRESLVICVQFGSRTASDAAVELRSLLATLRTDYIDVVTCYYVEQMEEWQQLIGPGGAMEYCRAAQKDRVVRRIGITTHQRLLAAEAARSGQLDALMIRYNAAHRGAEREVFPVTDESRVPVIAYTALRWGALLQPTPDDPPQFTVPSAPDWYRFVLQSPSVTVTMAAPRTRAELEQDLEVLRCTGPLSESEYKRLAEHGERVRRHAASFP
jgi:predicted aldo/keto reductase-like oxidoreductase